MVFSWNWFYIYIYTQSWSLYPIFLFWSLLFFYAFYAVQDLMKLTYRSPSPDVHERSTQVIFLGELIEMWKSSRM